MSNRVFVTGLGAITPVGLNITDTWNSLVSGTSGISKITSFDAENYKTKIAAALLSLFCIATAFIFHNDFADQMQLTSFLKNIALAGGFLILFVNGAKGLSLDNKFK